MYCLIVIWYQGESNTDSFRAPIYARLFQTLITDWRKQWTQGDFPFLFAQLANFTSSSDWATVRDAQRKTLSLSNTGMAVAVDIGDSSNVHPADKKDVGNRLALGPEYYPMASTSKTRGHSSSRVCQKEVRCACGLIMRPVG
jgi:hypothetical protein